MRYWHRFFLFCFGCLVVTTSALADFNELQNNNSSFEDGHSWTSLTANFSTVQNTPTRTWSSAGATGRETDIGNRYLRIVGTGDVGQFVAINNRSPYQILSLLAFRQSTGGGAPARSAFGITYYDSSWNEILVAQQEIGDRGSSNRGAGDGLVPYSLGLRVPAGAQFAYIWIWNSDGSTNTYADKFELVNYFTESNYVFDPSQTYGDQYTATQPTGRNLIVNGYFDTQFGREEYWNVEEVLDTVYADEARQNRLHMGGFLDANLIYQRIDDIQPGTNYLFSADYLRPVDAGSAGAAPYAGAGVDLFDANSNKLTSPSVSLQNTAQVTDPHQSRVNFTAPSNVAYAYAWVWVAGSDGSANVPLLLDHVVLRERGFSDIRLESSTYNIAESGQSIDIRVVRENGSDGPATVEYDTLDLTAIDGQDYQSRSGTVSWADGESGVRTISIPILDDNTAESDKQFLLTIDNPTGQVTLLAPRTATVTIDDDDSVSSQGDGLLAEYFNNQNLTSRQLVRTDETVDFDWGTGAPNPGIDADTFSVRWSGQIEPRFSETYTFRTWSDDGIRLWVNDTLIIDQWNDHAPTFHTGTIALQAGVLYNIRIEHYEATGGAVAQLAWSSPSQSLQVVPKSQLYAASEPPVGLDDLVAQTVISGLSQPTSIDWSPDGQNMYITYKDGRVRVVRNGALQPALFADLRSVVNGVRDRGLLDIAVHPDFANNPYVYLLYTYDPPQVFNNTGNAGPDGTGNRAGRITRITADGTNDYKTAIAGSEVVLLGTNSTWNFFNAFANSTNDFNEPPAGINPDGTNVQDFVASDSESHTIGSLVFGKDGALYVSVGDGTSYNAVDDRTVRVQDIDNLSGKVLRLNPLNGQGLADNPHYNGNPNANRSKVYQRGLRNPFRMAINRMSGRLFIGDVGWTAWEEVNSGPAGANFGWPYYEGGSTVSNRTSGYQNLPEAQAFYNSGAVATPSAYALSHSVSGINAIVLGDVYTGTTYPSDFSGDLFFNDLGQGIVRNLSFAANGDVSDVQTFATGAKNVVKIRQGPDGNLYFVDLDDNKIGRWVFE